jgi:hypothetical protein
MFTPFPNSGWVPDRPTGDDFIPVPGMPSPVMSDPKHPYVPNGGGRQPTYRVADLTNPILKPWAIEKMKKANDEVLAGKVPYITRERCWPAGVPGSLVNDRTTTDNYRTPHTEQIHTVERYKLIEGGKILQATITVDDPGTFNMAWSAVQRWRKTDRVLEENPCAENNAEFLGYDVVPIPMANKPDF